MNRITKDDSGELILVNIVEKIVEQKVDELISEMDMCKCKRCRYNACAIALNNLPPQYVTTEKGALLGKLDGINAPFLADLTVEVTKALLLVKDQPMHWISGKSFFAKATCPETFIEVDTGNLLIESYIDSGNKVGVTHMILEQDFTKHPELEFIRISMEAFRKFQGIEWK